MTEGGHFGCVVCTLSLKPGRFSGCDDNGLSYDVLFYLFHLVF